MMQITYVAAFSLQIVLKQQKTQPRIVGYTVRPGYSNGLFLYARQPRGEYVGFNRGNLEFHPKDKDELS